MVLEVRDWVAGLREATRVRALRSTARGLARLGWSLMEGPTRTELGLAQWRLANPDHDARLRQSGDNFAAGGGHRIAGRRRAGNIARSMTSVRAFRAFCLPELRKLGPHGPHSYLEFGACCGTSVLTVLEHFPRCKITAFEPMPDRTSVYEELRRFVPLHGRVTWIEDILEHHLEGLRAMHPEGISAIYMDTNHKFPNDLWYLEALLVERPLLAPDGLLICDDRLHSGTRRAVTAFLERHGAGFDYELVAGRWAMLRPRRHYAPVHWSLSGAGR